MAMASCVGLFFLYANWWISNVAGSPQIIWVLTSFSRHFEMTGVRPTGWKSFRQWMVVFFGMGMMIEDFRQGGMVGSVRHRLNIFVKSWSAQFFSTVPETSLVPLSTHLTSCSSTVADIALWMWCSCFWCFLFELGLEAVQLLYVHSVGSGFVVGDAQDSPQHLPWVVTVVVILSFVFVFQFSPSDGPVQVYHSCTVQFHILRLTENILYLCFWFKWVAKFFLKCNFYRSYVCYQLRDC